MSGQVDNASSEQREAGAGEPAPETKRRLAGWRKPEVAAQLVAVILGAVLGSVGTLVTTWWQAKAPHLSYVIGEGFPFRGDNEHIAVYNITIANDGNAQAEDVKAVIQLPGAKIDRVKITPSWLQPEYKYEKDGIQITIPSINPNTDETVQVALVANATPSLPEKPTVIVRGKGVNGELRRRDQSAAGSLGIWELLQLLPLMVSIGAVIAMYFLTKLADERSKNFELFNNLRMARGLIDAYETGAERLRGERDELKAALAKKGRRLKPKADDAGQHSEPLPSAE
jgi:hypothetical protein